MLLARTPVRAPKIVPIRMCTAPPMIVAWPAGMFIDNPIIVKKASAGKPIMMSMAKMKTVMMTTAVKPPTSPYFAIAEFGYLLRLSVVRVFAKTCFTSLVGWLCNS